MKKFLILTFHRKKNYGAALQAFALRKKIEQFADAKILDFNFRDKFNVKNLIIKIIMLKNNIMKNKNFNKFYNKYFKLTRKVKNIKQIQRECENFDGIFCGSDQVWALDIVREYSDVFFLNFNTRKEFLKNSYAASIGRDSVTELEKEKLKKLINSFNNISVREESAKKIIENLGIKPVENVIDPTFLLTKNEYEKIFNLVKEESKYILVYMLEINDQIINVVKEIEKTLKMKVICFNNRNYFGDNCECLPYSGPEEFVKLFYNASFVVTNSFHGTCFSIIFEKEFISVPHTSKNTRQENLLSKANLLDRIYDENKEIKSYIVNKVNYTEAKENLSQYIDSSIEFIKKSME